MSNKTPEVKKEVKSISVIEVEKLPNPNDYTTPIKNKFKFSTLMVWLTIILSSGIGVGLFFLIKHFVK